VEHRLEIGKIDSGLGAVENKVSVQHVVQLLYQLVVVEIAAELML